jgi:hypothetical protein
MITEIKEILFNEDFLKITLLSIFIFYPFLFNQNINKAKNEVLEKSIVILSATVFSIYMIKLLDIMIPAVQISLSLFMIFKVFSSIRNENNYTIEIIALCSYIISLINEQNDYNSTLIITSLLTSIIILLIANKIKINKIFNHTAKLSLKLISNILLSAISIQFFINAMNGAFLTSSNETVKILNENEIKD